MSDTTSTVFVAEPLDDLARRVAALIPNTGGGGNTVVPPGVLLGNASPIAQAAGAVAVGRNLTLSSGGVLSAADAPVLTVAGRDGAVTLSAADVSGVVASASLGQPSGVATLDSSGQVPAVQLPIGAGAGQIAAGNDARFAAAELTAHKGQANGYAGLDGTGKVPASQLSNAGAAFTYLGTWNASSNTPHLSSGVGPGQVGSYYVVTTPGSTTIDGHSGWINGNWIVWNGSVWNYQPGSLVSSVAAKTGDVSLLVADVSGAVDAATIGQPNGVASLTALGQVPAAQLPIGTGSGQVASATDARFAAAVQLTAVGQPNGVAPLGETGTIATSFLPPLLQTGTITGTALEATDPRIAGAIQSSARGAANGVAPLGSDSRVPAANLPAQLQIGTTAGTAAAGNDSRITGAVQSTAIGAVNGVASLGAAGQIPIGQIPTGQTSAAVAIGNDARIVNAVQNTALAVANGVATLDSGGKLTAGQIPSSIVTSLAATKLLGNPGVATAAPSAVSIDNTSIIMTNGTLSSVATASPGSNISAAAITPVLGSGTISQPTAPMTASIFSGSAHIDPQWYSATALYGTGADGTAALQAALAAAAVFGKPVLITGALTVSPAATTTFTLQPDTTLVVGAGTITINGTATVKFVLTGALVGPAVPFFVVNNANTTFAGAVQSPEVYAEWWGATGDGVCTLKNSTPSSSYPPWANAGAVANPFVKTTAGSNTVVIQGQSLGTIAVGQWLCIPGAGANNFITANNYNLSDPNLTVGNLFDADYNLVCQAWQASHAYAAGSYVTRVNKVYQTAAGGTSGTTGPSGTTPAVDGTVTWTYVTNGTVALGAGPHVSLYPTYFAQQGTSAAAVSNLPLVGKIKTISRNSSATSWQFAGQTVTQWTITLVAADGTTPVNAAVTLPDASAYAAIGNGNNGNATGYVGGGILRTTGTPASAPLAFPTNISWGTDNTAAINYAMSVNAPVRLLAGSYAILGSITMGLGAGLIGNSPSLGKGGTSIIPLGQLSTDVAPGYIVSSNGGYTTPPQILRDIAFTFAQPWGGTCPMGTGTLTPLQNQWAGAGCYQPSDLMQYRPVLFFSNASSAMDVDNVRVYMGWWGFYGTGSQEKSTFTKCIMGCLFNAVYMEAATDDTVFAEHKNWMLSNNWVASSFSSSAFSKKMIFNQGTYKFTNLSTEGCPEITVQNDPQAGNPSNVTVMGAQLDLTGAVEVWQNNSFGSGTHRLQLEGLIAGISQSPTPGTTWSAPKIKMNGGQVILKGLFSLNDVTAAGCPNNNWLQMTGGSLIIDGYIRSVQGNPDVTLFAIAPPSGQTCQIDARLMIENPTSANLTQPLMTIGLTGTAASGGTVYGRVAISATDLVGSGHTGTVIDVNNTMPVVVNNCVAPGWTINRRNLGTSQVLVPAGSNIATIV